MIASKAGNRRAGDPRVRSTPQGTVTIRGSVIELRYRNGMVERIANGSYVMMDAQGRTIVDRHATLADLPSDTRGVARVDDRRVISGIVHVLKSGCHIRPVLLACRQRFLKR